MKTVNWKYYFLGLVGINVLVVLVVLTAILLPGDNPERKANEIVSEHIDLTIETNKQDLNKLINSYLQNELKNQPLDYKVTLAEKVMLIGTITAFGRDIDLVMTFEPLAMENGDLLLKQESVSVGQLQLPVSYILKYISDNYSLPEWITIDSNARTVYAALTQLELKSNMKVKVDHFNLKNDDISFSLSVPLAE